MQRSSTNLLLMVVLCGACTKSTPGKEPPKPEASRPTASFDAGPALAPVKLALELAYIKGERSKDNHAYRYECKIEDGRVTYSGPYGKCVRGQCEYKEVKFAISPAQAQGLLDEVDRLGLFAEFAETKDTKLTGHYYKLSLDVAGDKGKGAIRVYGMRKAWGKDDSQNISEEAQGWVNNAEKLRRKIRDLVLPHLPDAR